MESLKSGTCPNIVLSSQAQQANRTLVLVAALLLTMILLLQDGEMASSGLMTEPANRLSGKLLMHIEVPLQRCTWMPITSYQAVKMELLESGHEQTANF